MHELVQLVMLLLVGLFVVGSIGSIVVVVISGVEDMKTILSKDDVPHQPIES